MVRSSFPHVLALIQDGFISHAESVVEALEAQLDEARATINAPTPAREREVEANEFGGFETEGEQKHAIFCNAFDNERGAFGRKVQAGIAALDALSSRPALASDPTKDLSAGPTTSPSTVGKEGPAQTGAGLADEFVRMAKAWNSGVDTGETEDYAFDEWCSDHSDEILAALRAAEAHGEAVEALRPWVKAEQARIDAVTAYNEKLTRHREEGVFPPKVQEEYYRMTNAGREANVAMNAMFPRARAILAKLDASQGAEGE